MKTVIRIRKDNAGFVLAGVMVALALLIIFMAAASTRWSFIVQRAKEEELIFRGEQYVRAIHLYLAKFNTYPDKLKELLDEKCIRRLYKDPMTESGEWILITGETASKAGVSQSSVGGTRGIIGVRSSSRKRAIKLYQNKRTYNEWAFVAIGSQGQGQTQPPAGREDIIQQQTEQNEPEQSNEPD